MPKQNKISNPVMVARKAETWLSDKLHDQARYEKGQKERRRNNILPVNGKLSEQKNRIYNNDSLTGIDEYPSQMIQEIKNPATTLEPVYIQVFFLGNDENFLTTGLQNLLLNQKSLSDFPGARPHMYQLITDQLAEDAVHNSSSLQDLLQLSRTLGAEVISSTEMKERAIENLSQMLPKEEVENMKAVINTNMQKAEELANGGSLAYSSNLLRRIGRFANNGYSIKEELDAIRFTKVPEKTFSLATNNALIGTTFYDPNVTVNKKLSRWNDYGMSMCNSKNNTALYYSTIINNNEQRPKTQPDSLRRRPVTITDLGIFALQKRMCNNTSSCTQEQGWHSYDPRVPITMMTQELEAASVQKDIADHYNVTDVSKTGKHRAERDKMYPNDRNLDAAFHFHDQVQKVQFTDANSWLEQAYQFKLEFQAHMAKQYPDLNTASIKNVSDLFPSLHSREQYSKTNPLISSDNNLLNGNDLYTEIGLLAVGTMAMGFAYLAMKANAKEKSTHMQAKNHLYSAAEKSKRSSKSLSKDKQRDIASMIV